MTDESNPCYVHVLPVDIRPLAQRDHCSNHPDQTTENSQEGFGLAGGGFGPYYICGICGNVFGKTQVEEDE